MSFPVAFQSAVFYFVACTPCAKVRHRHKAKERAKKERQDKARLETEQPGLYRHPSPFNTNPYWQQEISMGPSLPKKSASKNSSQRRLTSAGRADSALSISEHTTTTSATTATGTGTAAADSRLNMADSSTAVPEEDDGLSDDWNRRHGYQREDEELWGQWSGQRLMDAFSRARGSAGRLIESTLGIEKEVTDHDRRGFYFSPKNPPVNDYHPPVVSSKAPRREAHQWMLQPPPPAKVMEGKLPVSRAVSAGSKSSGRTLVAGDDPHLARLVQEKLVKERLMKETSRTEDELIESLFVTRSNRSASFPRSRSLSFDDTDEPLDLVIDRRRSSRLRPVAAPPGCDDEDEEGEDAAASAPRGAEQSSQTGAAGHAAQRPKLETILSTGSNSSGHLPPKKWRRQRSSKVKTLSGTRSPVGDDTD